MRTGDVKVGMKVRIKDHWVSHSYNHAGKMDHWLGQTMTVAYINSLNDDVKMIEDADENDGRGWYWYAEDFDPVIETDCKGGNEMKYQIGESGDVCWDTVVKEKLAGESTFDLPALLKYPFEDLVCKLYDEDLEALYAAVEEESRRREEQQMRLQAGAIVSAMDAYLQKFGDNRDFYSRNGDGMSMQDMHDAIIAEFDLNAQ